MKMELTYCLVCPICEQPITVKGITTAIQKIMLPGAARYAVCKCGQLVVDVTPEYIKRFNKKPRIYADVG